MLARLEKQDQAVQGEMLGLVLMHPRVAVAWIRAHFDQLEARFAA